MLISGIEYKLNKLIERHHLILTENRQYINKIQELITLNTKQKETIKQLEEKIKILKIAKSLESKEGNVEAKLKINELVREIEKCIGLLNT